MPRFSVSRSVPYTAQQVFAIARDVARYKEFLPLVRTNWWTMRWSLLLVF